MRVKPVCFYLPQFHRIPENDAWWGEGFTEWTSVARARPLFPGHAQPVRPATPFGAYDLLDRRVRAWQGELARAHGIYAFCYYHYWFGGKRLLEGPLERMLEDGAPELPFMLCWANEPWSRRWDGMEHDVLQPQAYGDEADWDEHFATLLRFFRDSRYVRVEDAPVLLIYRPGHIPCLSPMIARWRALAREAGLPGLHFVAVLGSFADNAAVPAEADAVCEFLPGWSLRLGMHGVRANGVRVLTAEQAMEVAAAGPRLHAVQYPGAFAAWDNTPRCGNGGLCYRPLSAERLTDLLEQRMRAVAEDRALPAPFLFINAWNEWGEGCFLEPDERWGTSRLEAVRDALARAETPMPAAPAPRSGRLVVRVGDVAPERPDAVVVACDPAHAALVELAERATVLVLDRLEPALVDLLAARHGQGRPSYVAAHLASMPAGTPGASVRVRADLLQHALRFAQLGEPLEIPAREVDLGDIPGPGASLGVGDAGQAIIEALALQDPLQGAVALLEACDRWPEHVAGLRALTRRLNDLGDPETASGAARRVLARAPRDPDALSELGRALFRSGRPKDAGVCLEGAVAAGPWHLRPWQYLFRWLERAPSEAAVGWAERLLENHPSNYALALMALQATPPAARPALLSRIAAAQRARPPAADEYVDMALAFGQAVARIGPAALANDEGMRAMRALSEIFPESAALADVEGHACRLAGAAGAAEEAFCRAARIRREARTTLAESSSSP